MVCSLCEGEGDGLCDSCESRITQSYRDRIADLEAKLAESVCSVCAGVPLASGAECICGGKGTHDAEVVGLRMGYLDLERQLADVIKGLVALSPSLANDPRPATLPDALHVVTAEYVELIQLHAELENELAEAQAQYDACQDHWSKEEQAWIRERSTLKATLARVREQYDQLILAVGNKYEGESRHQTALRYIQQAEQPKGQAASTLNAGKEAGG